MALTPAAMMSLRRGPTQGPTMTPGGADPSGAPGGAPGPGGGVPGAGLPGNPAAGDPGSLLMSAIADRMNQAKKANANFASSNLDQMLRVIGTMQIHIMQMHPEAARHLNKAWSSLDAAKKALNDAMKEQAAPPGPPLGFSGAGIGPTQAGMIPGGGGGGGMGGPT